MKSKATGTVTDGLFSGATVTSNFTFVNVTTNCVDGTVMSDMSGASKLVITQLPHAITCTGIVDVSFDPPLNYNPQTVQTSVKFDYSTCYGSC
jgi:hypothetical protein